jgi:hypothetical protein
MKFFANLITLVVFLVFGMPGMRERVHFGGPEDSQSQISSGGLAAFMAGVLILSVRTIVGDSHIYEGNNWVDVIKLPLLISGSTLSMSGFLMLTKVVFDSILSKSREGVRQLLS